MATYDVAVEHHGTRKNTNRFNRGHRLLSKRRWDDRIQATVNAEAELPWQCHARDRQQWKELKTSFNARVLRRQERGLPEVPTGRHMPQQ